MFINVCFNVDTTLKELRRFNVGDPSCFSVDFWLKMKIESTYIRRRCFEFEKTALVQLCQYLLY